MTETSAKNGGMKHTATSNCTGLDNPDEPLKCVFSTVTTVKLGTGSTARKQLNKLLWYVKQREEDAFGVRKINPQFVPVGEETTIDRETLLSEYTPEVMVHNTRVAPAMKGLAQALARGDKYREEGQPLSAEMEYTKALDVDVSNVRGIFGLGLVYLERKNTERARAVFEELVDMEAAFNAEHKHLFNEFGIALRKNELYEEAAQYYGRAVELTEDDENLYYNLARVFYEKDDWEQCYHNVSLCLKLNSGHEHALSLCNIMVALAANDDLRAKHGKPRVPSTVAKNAGALMRKLNDGSAVKIDINQPGSGDLE